jgi:mannose-6-phosphate isomerase-like protein (cupin superfamily)
MRMTDAARACMEGATHAGGRPQPARSEPMNVESRVKKGEAAPAEMGHNSAAIEEKRQNLYHNNKNRVFVRAIAGEYNVKDELKRLRSVPRVRKAKDIPFVDGPACYSRHYIEPKDGITQTFHMHLEEYAPGAKSQKHGHVNEAAFYILDGTGYEVHDGVRYDWKAGDVAIVHNNCVHQHFNADPKKPARALVIKTKPMYLFLNMLFQKTVEERPLELPEGAEGFTAREHDDNLNHSKEGY